MLFLVGWLRALFPRVGFQVDLKLWVSQLVRQDDLVAGSVDYLDAGDWLVAFLFETLHPLPHVTGGVPYSIASPID